MYLVVGLGNPGREYEGNRHNAGFMALDEMRRHLAFPDFREKFSGVWTRGDAFGDAVALLKPMTFMNVSGECVQPAAAFLKVDPAHIVVVHDEIDLPFGDVRVKVGGGHAGNNGIRSIIQRLGTPEFVRVRVGVGKPPAGFRGEVADWVLSNFDPSERAEWPEIEKKAIAAVRKIVEEGPAAAMTATNAKAPPRNGPPKGQKQTPKTS
jgi:PTH1 family peptidyl-tRNA hydrolase